MNYKLLYILTAIFSFILLKHGIAVEGPPKINRICNQPSGNTIYWNNQSDFCASFQIMYIYYRESEDEPFKVLDSIYNYNEAENYFHQGGGRTYEYFIQVNYDCTYITPLYSDTVLVNISRPAQGKLDSISIINSNIVLGWQAEQEDIFGYVIYYVNNQGDNIILDTIYGKDNSYYIDSTRGDPDINSERYRFAAFDSCFNISAISNSHTSINLNVNVDACNNSVMLEWNDYLGWEKGVSYYIIYLQNIDTSNTFTVLDTVFSTNKYNINDLQGGYEYCFKVRAFANENSFTSSSNEVCIDANFIVRTQEIYLKNITTNLNTGNIEVSWYLDTYEDIKEINILRGSDSFNLNRIATISRNGTFQNIYIDENVNSKDSIYYYRIEPVDICDNLLEKTYASSNIVLTLKYNTEKELELSWNPYYGWDADIDYYRIYRTNTLTDPYIWNEIQIMYPQAFIESYIDEDEINEFGNYGVCYYIEAIEKSGNQYGFKERSFSNISCKIDDAIVYIPNSFAPVGRNTKFNVNGLYIDYEHSKMSIYDRWGALLFETNDIKEGWDGSINQTNRFVSEDVYFYFIRIQGVNGAIKDYKGTVKLLK